ncbi:hypothetical protein B0T19DRAFT_58634 [Cercophora scortea]|uniref:Uncharacterized protein n=1 Tax=Cercophora scortea TaxID=314031 RepID=A0AAE0J5P8_9PEZI|nr:hypothetical protein B0T19DRAFT_58634 [Cercophora scortea]
MSGKLPGMMFHEWIYVVLPWTRLIVLLLLLLLLLPWYFSPLKFETRFLQLMLTRSVLVWSGSVLFHTCWVPTLPHCLSRCCRLVVLLRKRSTYSTSAYGSIMLCSTQLALRFGLVDTFAASCQRGLQGVVR